MKATARTLLCSSKALALFLVMMVWAQPSCAASATERAEEGFKLYEQEQYEEALKAFLDAQVELPEDEKLKYNVANTQYKMGRHGEALKGYLDVVDAARDPLLEEKSLYNAGNALYKEGRLEESIEYYKKALELNPDDEDAKYNLEFVREELKRRINQAREQQERREKERQEQEKQEQTSERDRPSEQDEEEEQSAANGAAEQSQEEEKTATKDEERKEEVAESESVEAQRMSPEEAERWLNVLKEDREKFLNRKRIEGQAGRYRPEKDW